MVLNCCAGTFCTRSIASCIPLFWVPVRPCVEAKRSSVRDLRIGDVVDNVESSKGVTTSDQTAPACGPETRSNATPQRPAPELSAVMVCRLADTSCAS